MEKRFTYTMTNPYLFAAFCFAFIAIVATLFWLSASRDALATIGGGVSVYLAGQVKVNGKGLFS
jgi:hypothetical protein